MEINSGMNQDERAEVSGALAKLLADTYLLYLKTQNIHWNIHGPEFYSLHLLTEKHYEEMAEAVDEIAERIRALGFFVEGTTSVFQKLSSITEDEKIHPKHIYIEDLIRAHEIVMQEVRALGEMAEKYRDHGTVDLIGRRLLFHEKSAWMLRSQL
jgi:starvation-inducible DNA-binding protein